MISIDAESIWKIWHKPMINWRQHKRMEKYTMLMDQFSSVQLLSYDPMDCSTPGFPHHHQLLGVTQTHFHWVDDFIQPSHPLLLSPSIFPSIRVFSNESALHIRWPKYWSFSFNISPSNEYSALISFRMDWLDRSCSPRDSQERLSNYAEQHHSSKTSILWCSPFFIVQLSHPYMTTGKTTALTRWNILDKVMSLFYNILP